MKNIEKYQKLAQLIVKRGVNVQKGQPVLIRIAVDQYEFARMLTKEAYKAGASTVEIDYRDTNLVVCR